MFAAVTESLAHTRDGDGNSMSGRAYRGIGKHANKAGTEQTGSIPSADYLIHSVE